MPQGYKVVQCTAFRYRDLKEGRDGAHLMVSVKKREPFKFFLIDQKIDLTNRRLILSGLRTFVMLFLVYLFLTFFKS